MGFQSDTPGCGQDSGYGLIASLASVVQAPRSCQFKFEYSLHSCALGIQWEVAQRVPIAGDFDLYAAGRYMRDREAMPVLGNFDADRS